MLMPISHIRQHNRPRGPAAHRIPDPPGVSFYPMFLSGKQILETACKLCGLEAFEPRILGSHSHLHGPQSRVLAIASPVALASEDDMCW